MNIVGPVVHRPPAHRNLVRFAGLRESFIKSRPLFYGIMLTIDHLRRYQSAVYLNNTAVSFMSHGEHRQAMEALSGALVLIKSLVQLSESTMAAQKAELFAQIKVQKTQQALARLPVKSLDEEGGVPLHIVCFDGSLNAHVLLSSDDDWYTGVAVLMDDVSLSDNDDMMACIQRIAPAIILSNFALSHLYAASRCPLGDSPSRQDRLVDAALHMLNIGQAIMGVQDFTMEVTEDNMFLAMVLANNTCCVQQQDSSCRCYDALFRSSQELDLLKELSSQMVHLTRSFVPVAGAA